jgi:PAS domain-containing protein
MMAGSNIVKPMIDLVNANWFFDNVNDAIFIHDLGGNVLAVNQIACQRLGYSHNELLQMRVSDLDSPANRAQYAASNSCNKPAHSFWKVRIAAKTAITSPLKSTHV